jgi:hypothetical protein
MAGRPDLETLALLREIVEEIGTNEAVVAGGVIFSMTMQLAPTLAWSVVEPEPKVLRHLLDRLRHLDMPTSDVRLERVYPILERVGIRTDWRPLVKEAMAAYAAGQLVRSHEVQDPDEGYVEDPEQRTWIQPREAFRLWAYGGVIHHEYAKEQRWSRLGPLGQPLVRDMGHHYAMMLLDQAEVLTRLLRHGMAGDVPGRS